jgi:hypothetical protein
MTVVIFISLLFMELWPCCLCVAHLFHSSISDGRFGTLFALLVYPSSHPVSQISDHIASGLSLITFFCFYLVAFIPFFELYMMCSISNVFLQDFIFYEMLTCEVSELFFATLQPKHF